MIARDVNAICNEDSTQNDSKRHNAFAERSRYALDLLLAYTAALSSVRDSGLVDHDTFEWHVISRTPDQDSAR